MTGTRGESVAGKGRAAGGERVWLPGWPARSGRIRFALRRPGTTRAFGLMAHRTPLALRDCVWCALAALGLLALAAVAAEARELATSLSRLAAQSESVVHGWVLSTRSAWVHDDRGRHIRTYARVRTIAWLKGAGGAEVEVEFPGGVVGNIRETVIPSARVSPGEEVVLFARGTPPRVVGHAGKLLVERGAASGVVGTMPLGDLVTRLNARTAKQPLPLSPSSAPAPTGGTRLTPPRAATAAGPVTTLGGWTTIKSEDFEGAWPNNWTLYGNVGNPAVVWAPDSWQKRNGTYSGWPSGSVADAASSYMYKPGSGTLISRMTYGPFDLRGARDARVTFWMTYDLAANDKLRWEASKDGTTFYGAFQGQGNTLPTWNQVTFDLKAVPTLGNLCGHNGIYFRLQCDSAAGGSWVRGPFVDDILIEKDVVDNPPDLVIDAFSVTPVSTSEGTQLTASVTVRNAGTTTASGVKVDFYKHRTSAPGSADAGDHEWTVTLAPSESTVLTWNFTPATWGTYHAYAVIDRTNALIEYDESNNKRGPISYRVTQTGWQVLKVEDFEGSWPNDWSVTSQYINRGTWAPQTWLASDTKAGGGQASLVDPASDPGTIQPGSWGRMTYGPFSLVGATQARMTFFLSYQLGTNNTVRWEGSTDGTIFSGGGSQTGGSNLPGWTPVTFDLSALLGSPSAYVRISCEAGATDEGVKGPFVDDIVIERYGSNLPWISSITPGSASAGTNSQVTIAGTGFGATRGSGNVKFFLAPGYPKLDAAIVSWSDTSITCTVPEDASSGPVTVVNNAGGESNNYTFVVTFGYGNKKWPGSSPTMSYRINENTSDCTGEGAAVQAAAATWSAAGAAFAFAYAGTTSATNSSQNGVNEIFWDSTPEDPNASALNTTWATVPDGVIIESDIAFNDEKTWSTDGSASDVQSIALHELGHSLQLSDLYGDIGDGVNDKAKVMCGVGTTGQLKRSLHQTDIDGIRWIYPSTTLGITVDPLTWNIAGLQPQGATCLTTAGTRFTVTNTGNVAETLRLRVSTQDSLGKWLAGGSVGADQYWLRALFVGDADTPVGSDFGAEDTLTTSAQPATANTRFNRAGASYGVSMPASSAAYLWFRLDLPNPASDGQSHQITVEVSCETP